MNNKLSNKFTPDKKFHSFLRKRSVRNLIIILIVIIIVDVKYADIHGSILRKFKRDQRYHPANSIKSACRASLFREFRRAPVTSVISRINEKEGKLGCNLNAGSSIGYNCQLWSNRTVRKGFYMFFTFSHSILKSTFAFRDICSKITEFLMSTFTPHLEQRFTISPGEIRKILL